MPKKMRVIGWQVQPIIMVDDGEELVSIPVQPQTIARAGWQAFKDGGDDAALEALRTQVEGPAEPAAVA